MRLGRRLRTGLAAVAVSVSIFFHVGSVSLGSGAYEVTDAVGANVAFPASPVRIVTLAPSLGELAADIASEHMERIVGVSEYTDYPPALLHVAKIGPYNHVNLELIAALKPDLVLATRDGNVRDQIDHLRELGLHVVVVSTDSFSGVEDSIRLVARAMGDPAAGDRMAKELDAGLARISARAKTADAIPVTAPAAKPGSSKTHHRVLLQLGDDPLVVVGGHAFLADALTLVGADNVYADMKDAYPRPALEDAIARDPDTIIILAMGSDPTFFKTMAARWALFPKLSAVKLKRVKILHSDALMRPSMRLLEGLSLLQGAVDAP